MSSLKSILRAHHVPAGVMGGGRRVQASSMKAELVSLRQHLTSMFRLTAGMIGAAFVVGIVMLFIYVQTPAMAAAVFAAMGVSVGGAIEYMRRLSRDMAQVTLLVILCSELSEENLANIVNALVPKL